MSRRLNKLLEKLKSLGLDALLVTSPANISYLTNYISRDSWLLVGKKGGFYFTDPRYTIEAKHNLGTSYQIVQTRANLTQAVNKICQKQKITKIGFEKKYLAFDFHKKLGEGLVKKELIPTSGLIEEFRQIKNKREIAKIRKATQITIQALRFIKNHIAPGITEIEIVGELERFIRYHGASGSSFEVIVASGVNSSYPHHLSSAKKIRKNEPVLIDIGVNYQGYKSDLTRVFFSGKMSALEHKIYKVISQAQKLALAKIKPQVKINEVDRAARNYIQKKGFGRFFTHNLGHGIGLEVHEAPNIGPKQEVALKEGMIFTLEPAIYLPGKFGIRIEDMVLVTKKGVELLSVSLNQ